MIWLLILVAIALGLMILLHLRPLSDEEILALAGKRRSRSIRDKYRFQRYELPAHPDLKKAMPPNGGFMRFDHALPNFPCTAAGLLKYKKHEWILVAFESNGHVKDVWMNKGIDRTQVCCHLSPETLVHYATRNQSDSLLVFHNHPNPDPGKYSCTQASQQDYISAGIYAQALAPHGIGLVEFVCEREVHYEYYRHFPATYKPACLLEPEIRAINGRSRLTNLSLHCERLF